MSVNLVSHWMVTHPGSFGSSHVNFIIIGVLQVGVEQLLYKVMSANLVSHWMVTHLDSFGSSHVNFIFIIISMLEQGAGLNRMGNIAIHSYV